MMHVASSDVPMSEPSLIHEEEQKSSVSVPAIQVEEEKNSEHHIPSLVDEGDPTMRATALEITYCA